MRRRRYPPEIEKLILDNVSMNRRDLARLASETDPSGSYTVENIRGWLKRRNMVPGKIPISERGGDKWRPIFSEEQKEYIRNNIYGTTYDSMASMLKEKFDVVVRPEQVRAFCKNNKIRNGRDTKFGKGRSGCYYWKEDTVEKIKANGSRKRSEFKKGHRPKNTLPVGAEIRRSYKDGSSYIWVKTSEPNIWRPKHRIVWESAYGPVEKGMVIIFLDGDTGNTDLNNLAIVSKRQHSVMNNKKLRSVYPEVTKVGVTLSKLMLSTHDKRCGKTEITSTGDGC